MRNRHISKGVFINCWFIDVPLTTTYVVNQCEAGFSICKCKTVSW